MSAPRWPDWLGPHPQNNFPAAFRLIVSAITGAGLALSFTWLYFPAYAWVSVGLFVDDGARREAQSCVLLRLLSRPCIRLRVLSWIAEVLAVHGGTSRLVGWGILLLIAMAWGVLTGGFHLDGEPHRAPKCRVRLHSSAICVGHIGVCPRAPAGNRFSVESARIFRGGESGVAANNYGHRNLRLVVGNGGI